MANESGSVCGENGWIRISGNKNNRDSKNIFIYKLSFFRNFILKVNKGK